MIAEAIYFDTLQVGVSQVKCDVEASPRTFRHISNLGRVAFRHRRGEGKKCHPPFVGKHAIELAKGRVNVCGTHGTAHVSVGKLEPSRNHIEGPRIGSSLHAITQT